MERRKYDNFLFYADPDDPRLHVYMDPRVKLISVSLNFGHPRAWRALGVITGVLMLPVAIFAIAVRWAREAGWLDEILSPIAGVSFVVVYTACLLAVIVHCYRAAERELRQCGDRRDVKDVV